MRNMIFVLVGVVIVGGGLAWGWFNYFAPALHVVPQPPVTTQSNTQPTPSSVTQIPVPQGTSTMATSNQPIAPLPVSTTTPQAQISDSDLDSQLSAIDGEMTGLGSDAAHSNTSTKQ